MASSDAVDTQTELIKQRLAAGHSSKAERAFKKLVGEMTSEELRLRESSLRTLSSLFLPAHKARHRRIEEHISRQSTSIPDTPSTSDLGKLDVLHQTDCSPVVAVVRQMSSGSVEEETKEREFAQLVAEIRSLGFTKSFEVSNYIVKHRLGKKYGHISGLLTMEQNGERWKFDGGFPRHIYARLCDELGLGNRGSTARPVDFVPYSALE